MNDPIWGVGVLPSFSLALAKMRYTIEYEQQWQTGLFNACLPLF